MLSIGIRIVIIGLGRRRIRGRKRDVVYRMRLRRVIIWRSIKNVVIRRVIENKVIMMSKRTNGKWEILILVVRWIVMKINGGGRKRYSGGRLIIKYIEYNAIVVIVLMMRRGGIREEECRKCLKYRMLRGMVRMGVIMRWRGK